MNHINLESYPVLPSGSVVADTVQYPGGSCDALQLLPKVDGTTVDAAFSILSTRGAFLTVCVTTAERDAMVAKVGMQVYNISTDTYDSYYSNNTWISFGTQSGGPIVTSKVSLGDGTSALPSLTFTSDTDIGLFRPGANTLGIVGDVISLTARTAGAGSPVLRFYNTANTHYVGLACSASQASDITLTLPTEFPLRPGNPITSNLLGVLSFGSIVSATEFRMWNDDNSNYTGITVNGSAGNTFNFPISLPDLNGSPMIATGQDLSFSDAPSVRNVIFYNVAGDHSTTIEISDLQATDRTYTIPDIGADGNFVINATVTVTGTSQQMVANGIYIASNSGLVTLTLPTVAAVGSTIEVTGFGSGGWRISQNANQQIIFGNIPPTTVGVGGYMVSTDRYDCVKLRCLTANLVWTVVAPQGNPDAL